MPKIYKSKELVSKNANRAKKQTAICSIMMKLDLGSQSMSKKIEDPKTFFDNWPNFYKDLSGNGLESKMNVILFSSYDKQMLNY